MTRRSTPLAIAALALVAAGSAAPTYAGPQPIARTPAARTPVAPHHARAAVPLPPAPPDLRHLVVPGQPLPQACLLQVAHPDRSGRTALYLGGPVQPCHPPVGEPDGRIIPVLPR